MCVLCPASTQGLRAGCSWYAAPPRIAITGYNNKLIRSVSADQCKVACERETSFVCRSVDYNSRRQLCYMSSADRYTVQLTRWDDYQYYEIACDDGELGNTTYMSYASDWHSHMSYQ